MPETPARVTTGALTRGDHGSTAARVGHRHGAFQHLAATRVDLGPGQPHGLAQRLGQLEQQLVHGDGPGQPAAERAQRLVGRFPRPVDEPGGGGQQPVPGWQVAGRRHRRGEHGQAEDLPVAGSAGRARGRSTITT